MERSDGIASMLVTPNRSIGLFVLGASLHETLAQIKAQPTSFPSFEIYYDRYRPLSETVAVDLPRNGIRARFDGKEQRLRLIEVYDFSRTKYMYKDIEIGKALDTASFTPASTSRGPSFRHVYDKLLGPTFGGEYDPPLDTTQPNVSGKYVLSYPGIAFSFPVKHSAYSPNKEYVPLLSSSAASPATSMVVFHGEDWPTVSQTLFASSAATYRAHNASYKGRDESAEDIEYARVVGSGKLELVRRSGPPVDIVLGETTPQDLITDLGAPDAIHWKSDRRLSIHKERSSSQASDASVGMFGRSRDLLPDSPESSALHSDDDESSDWEDDDAVLGIDGGEGNSEHFYNYFALGFDVLISESSHHSPAVPGTTVNGAYEASDGNRSSGTRLTATKIVFHGNVPGSYQFNRHRRCRWILEHIPTDRQDTLLTSENDFSSLSSRLRQIFKGSYSDLEEEALMQRGMAINRGWGDSPGSSCELLGGFEESTPTVRRRVTNDASSSVMEGSEGTGVGRTMLYGFPGMIFEVMENDAICTLTIY